MNLFEKYAGGLEGGGGGGRLIEDYKCALEDCELTDLGFHGPKYTWNN